MKNVIVVTSAYLPCRLARQVSSYHCEVGHLFFAHEPSNSPAAHRTQMDASHGNPTAIACHKETFTDGSAGSESTFSGSGDVPEQPGSMTADAVVERILDLKYKWSGTVYEISSALDASPWEWRGIDMAPHLVFSQSRKQTRSKT